MQFYYEPTRLAHAVKEAQKIHKRISDPDPRDAELWLEKFLKQLAQADPSSFHEIASTLRLSQLRLLARYLPRLHGNPLFDRVAACLRLRPDAQVCSLLWGLLGRYCDSANVVALLQELRADHKWSSMTPTDLPPLPELLIDGSNVAAGLVTDYARKPQRWTEAVTRWKALATETTAEGWDDLPLGRHCLRRLLLGPDTRTFKREDGKQVKGWVNALLRERQDLRRFAKNYLETLEPDAWHEPIVSDVVKWLGDPRLKPDEWREISDDVQKAIIRWINTRKLTEFFLNGAGDRNRFEFWQHFVDDMGPYSEGRLNERRGFFEFPGFGVVEFMEIGNAAYLYPLDVYQELRMRRAVSNSELKDTSRALDRILHFAGWESRWQSQIRRMIQQGKRV